MSRPKAFAADEALQAAITVFWERGYEATSLPDLLDAMGIGRQSLYDTFGDKQSLYRKALDAYRLRGQAWLDGILHEGVEPLTGIRALLQAVAERDTRSCRRGCLLLNAAGDPGRDPEIAKLVQRHTNALLHAFVSAVQRGQADGSITTRSDADTLARFLLVTFLGLVTAARTGLDRAGRQHAITVALASLSP